MKLGIHVSVAGSLSKSIERGRLVGAEVIQVFTSNPKGWNFNVRSKPEIDDFLKNKERSQIDVFGHSIYLVNLASSNNFIYTNSINSLISGLVLASRANFRGVVTHLGSSGNDQPKDGIKRIKNALAQTIDVTKESVPILLETDAGSGNHIGSRFEELGEIINDIRSSKLKVCLDTAHIFASGYDIRKPHNIEKALNNFDKSIGIENLALIHLNDSKSDLGSRVDRHEIVGEGKIGLESFKYLINHQKLKNIFGIAETPDNKDNALTEKNSLNILKSVRTNE